MRSEVRKKMFSLSLSEGSLCVMLAPGFNATYICCFQLFLSFSSPSAFSLAYKCGLHPTPFAISEWHTEKKRESLPSHCLLTSPTLFLMNEEHVVERNQRICLITRCLPVKRKIEIYRLSSCSCNYRTKLVV